MKRLKCLPLMLLLVGLTGCIQEYTLSEEQSDSVAEYMSGKLLEYDKDYDQKLLFVQELPEDTQADKDVISDTAPEIVKSSSAGNTAGTKKQTGNTLEEVLDVEDFHIQYTGYKITDTYPDEGGNAYFSLTPREGNQLLVVSFEVKNTTKNKKTLDLSKSKIVYQLDIGVGTIYKPLLTLLENDLQYINISIPAKEAKQVLLVFEIAKGTNMSDLNLNIAKDNRSFGIEIQ